MQKILLLSLCFLCAFHVHADSTEIVACIDDHPPYQILAEKPHGTHISALEVLAKVLNRQLRYVESPNFARCVALLKKGEVDVVAGLLHTEEREKFAFYTPFKPADALVVVSKDGITISNYNDLNGKIIGIARGTSHFPRFDKDETLNKITIQNVRVGITLLLKNRIDLMMLSPANLKTLSADIIDANLKISPMDLEELRNKETSFGFSKANKLGLPASVIAEKVSIAYKDGQFN